MEISGPFRSALVGLFFLYLVVVKQAYFGYVVPGVLLTLGGVLLTLHAAFFPRVPLDRFWPLFMTIAGISLISYGRRLETNRRVAVVVPGTVIVILSFLFLPFSLELITQKFAEVVSTWWPVLFLVLSAALFGEYLRKKRR